MAQQGEQQYKAPKDTYPGYGANYYKGVTQGSYANKDYGGQGGAGRSAGSTGTSKSNPPQKKKASTTKKKSSSAYKPPAKKSSSSGGKSTSKTAKPTTTKSSSTSSKSTTTTSSSNYSKQAKDAVSAELDPKIKALKDQQTAYDKQQAALQEDNKKRGKQVSHDIEFLYQNLDQMLAQRQQETASAYSDASQRVDQNYANLLTSLTNNTKQSVDKVNAEAARLGLAAPVESQAGADGNFANMLAQTNRQNAALMLAAQSGNAASTGNFMRDASKGLGVQTNADFKSANDKALNDLVRTQLAQDTEYGNKLTDLESQRSTMERQYLQQLEQQAYDRQQEAQQQQFMNQLAISKFNLSQDKFSADQAYRQATLELEKLKIINAAAKASGTPTTYNRSGAYNYISGLTGIDAGTKSALTQAFTTSMQAGEFDFNDPKNREKAINLMRQWLATNQSQFNTGTNMQYLINAYDTYMGANYA